MIPLKDTTPRRSFPLVTIVLIIANVAVFIHQITLSPAASEAFVRTYALTPYKVQMALSGHHYTLAQAIVPLFTSMFLHGGFLHILGNMWFLWIFGDNIEDYLGHFKYLIFYLTSGLAAAFAQVLLSPHSRVPTVGASGAIAGVLGAYFVLYPKARVLIWFPIFFFFYLPAWVTLGYWFVIQFVSGAATSLASYSDTAGGVAFWAHVGGFVAGIVLIKLLPERPRRYRYGTW